MVAKCSLLPPGFLAIDSPVRTDDHGPDRPGRDPSIPGTAWASGPDMGRMHLAKAYFAGLEGDVRVVDGNTIQVTYYNRPTRADSASTTKPYRPNSGPRELIHEFLGFMSFYSTFASGEL